MSTLVLVTGGGGFLGRAVVEQLLAAGYRVRSFARGDYPDLTSMGVENRRGDLTNRDAVRDACAGCAAVFHVAAKASFWGPSDSFYGPNVIGTRNIVDACRAEGVGRLVYTSSASVVFDGRDIEGGDESLPYPDRPYSAYAATKGMAERLVLATDSPALKTLALRPHILWGPRDTQIIPRIIAQARAGKVRRVGSGKNTVDTTYIDNAALAHLRAAEALESNPRASGRAYFIGNGEPVNLWDLVDRVLALAGLPPVTRSIPRSAALALGGFLERLYAGLKLRTEPRLTRFLADELSASHWFDISLARRELGYQPAVSVEEGLMRLGAWLRGDSTPLAPHPG